MTDNPDPQGAAAAGQPQQPQVQMRVLGQFIRDMSFENIMAQNSSPSNGSSTSPLSVVMLGW